MGRQRKISTGQKNTDRVAAQNEQDWATQNGRYAIVKTSVASSNLLNAAPVIALCLSALLLQERLTLMKLVSGGIALLGVGLMVDHKRVDARQPVNVATQA